MLREAICTCAQATRDLHQRPTKLPAGVRMAELQPGTLGRAAPRFVRQAFTGGDACEPPALAAGAERGGAGRARAEPGAAPRRRSAELWLGCPPDVGGEAGDAYLVVLEPEPCRYVLVLWHPRMCAVLAGRREAGPRDAAGGRRADGEAAGADASWEMEQDVEQAREGAAGGDADGAVEPSGAAGSRRPLGPAALGHRGTEQGREDAEGREAEAEEEEEGRLELLDPGLGLGHELQDAGGPSAERAAEEERGLREIARAEAAARAEVAARRAPPRVAAAQGRHIEL